MSLIIDKIQNQKAEVYGRALLFCGIGLLCLAFIKVFIKDNLNIAGIGFWLDFLLIIIPASYLIFKSQRYLKEKASQFIEWRSDNIFFRLKNDKTTTTIDRSIIKTIDINLNIITVSDMENSIFKLDISDFSDYGTRAKIKNYFELEKAQSNIK